MIMRIMHIIARRVHTMQQPFFMIMPIMHIVMIIIIGILHYSCDICLLCTSFLEVCILCAAALYDNADMQNYNGHYNDNMKFFI